MKPFICTFLSCWLFYSSYAQDSTTSLSQFEVFTTQSNKILKIEARVLGTIGSRTVALYKTTDMSSGASRKAVTTGYNNYNSQLLSIDQQTLYIDQNDLDTLVDVLTRFVQIASSPKPPGYMQYSFITTSDIVFSCMYDPFNDNWQYSMGKIYKNLRTCVPHTLDTFNRKRFTELVDLLRKASTLSW